MARSQLDLDGTPALTMSAGEPSSIDPDFLVHAVPPYPQMICRYLPDTTLIYVNDAYCEQHGPRDSLIGRRYVDLLPESRRAVVLRQVDDMVSSLRIHSQEIEVDYPDGSPGWQEWIDVPIASEDGRVHELQGIGRDITGRKQRERGLTAQQEITQQLVDGHDLHVIADQILASICAWLGFAFGAIWQVGEHDDILRCAGVQDVAGDPNRSLARTTRDTEIGPADRCHVRTVWSSSQPYWCGDLAGNPGSGRAREAAARGLTTGFWTPIRSRRQTLGVIELMGRCARQPEPATLQMLAVLCSQVAQFIERSRAQDALERSGARFRALIQHATDGIIIAATDGTMSYCSESAGTMLRQSPDGLIGTSWLMLIHPDDREAAKRFGLRIGRLPNAAERMELRWRCGDSEWIIVEAWARDLSHEPSVGGLVINLHDVTAQRMSERALRQLSGRLLRLQDEERRRIAGDLHDGTAQDLLAIGFNLDRLRRQAATQHVDLETQISDSESLVQKALRDIRTLSYLLHPPLLDEMGLPAALRWLVDGFTARSGIDVTYVEDSSTGRMPRDIEIALFRIAQESLTNVHRHSGSSSAVVRLSLGAEGAVLVVKDRGKGKVTDAVTGGDGQAEETGTLGVGIAGMRERIRQLGGTLTVLSDNRGTTVEAWVPMAQSAP